MLLMALAYLPSLISELLNFGIAHIPGASEMISDPVSGIPTNQPVGIWVFITAAISIIGGIVWARLGIGLVKTSLMILEDTKPTKKDLCVPFRYLLRLIGGGILVGLAVIVGLIALIIPGIYIAIRLSMFKYFIAQWYGAIDAIKASWAATEWNVWNLVGLWIINFFIVLLGALAILVGLLWAIPTAMLAQAYVYTKLKANIPSEIKPLN